LIAALVALDTSKPLREVRLELTLASPPSVHDLWPVVDGRSA
jgi:hypothetical protein